MKPVTRRAEAAAQDAERARGRAAAKMGSAPKGGQDEPTSLARMALLMPSNPVNIQAARTIVVYEQELVGTVIDVTYLDGRTRKTYRAKVTKYNPTTGFHHINSKGYSTWKNQAFTDEIDVNLMNLKNLIRIHSGAGGRAAAAPAPALPAPAARGRRSSAGRRYKDEVVGELCEVTYPEGTFRVRIIEYINSMEWHIVDSEGLSTWEGESFTDELILEEMEDEGNLIFLGRGAGAGTGAAAAAGGRRPAAFKRPVGRLAGRRPSEATSAATRPALEIPREEFTAGIVNQIVDIYYDDPPAVYRMRVTDFDEKTKWHHVKSYGKYGAWDGSAFSDVLDLSEMYARGKAIFVKGLDLAKPPIGIGTYGSSQRLEQHELEELTDRGGGGGGDPDYEEPGSGSAAGRGRRREEARPTREKFAKPPQEAAASSSGVPGAKKRGRPPTKARVEEPAEEDPPAAKRRGRPPSASRDSRDSRGSSGKKELEQQFGDEICGQVVDLTYSKPPPKKTFRVVVKKFDAKQGLHLVSSRGHSLWKNMVFEQEVNLNRMYAAGEVSFLTGEDAVRAASDQEHPPTSGVSTRRKQTRTGAPPAATVSAAASSSGDGKEKEKSSESLAQAAAAAKAANAAGTASGASGGGLASTGASAASASEAPPPKKQRRSFGPEMVGRVVDVAHTEEENKYFRVHVAEYDLRSRKHRVESYCIGDREEQEVVEWLDLNGLLSLGRLEVVDGQDNLRRSGHALVGEEVHFLADQEQADDDSAESRERWRAARIVGWWPQEIVPPVVVGGRGPGSSRQAIFVAEESGRGDKWQLTLNDAMLAAAGNVKQQDGEVAGQRQALFEVFAGSCGLSLAFRRAGAAALCYDSTIDSTQDFASDDGFVTRLEEMEKPWDIVHFAPPETDDPRIVFRLAAAVRSLHAMNRGFAVECGAESKLWTAEDMQELERLEGVEGVTLDLENFGAPKPLPVQLLTNRAEWLAQLSRSKRRSARTTRGAAARAAAAAEDPADLSEEGLRRYPRAFCEVYAELILRGAAASGGDGSEKEDGEEEDEHEEEEDDDDEEVSAAGATPSKQARQQPEQPPARTVSAASEAEGNTAEEGGEEEDDAAVEGAQAVEDEEEKEEAPLEDKQPGSGKEEGRRSPAQQEDEEEEEAKEIDENRSCEASTDELFAALKKEPEEREEDESKTNAE